MQAEKAQKRIDRMSRVLSKGDLGGGIKPSKSVEKTATAPPQAVKRASILFNYQGMSKEGQASEVGVENERLKTSIQILQNNLKMRDEDSSSI